jgi:hypothetical protein
MSDARDAVAEALALNKRLAASLLVQKQELEAELANVRSEGRAEAITAELARVDAAYRSALAELAELRKLGGQAVANEARAVVAGGLPGDPVLQTHEERALDAARAHLAELEVQAGLSDAPDEAAPAAAAPTREQADAQAREEFEALRAKRGAPDAPAPPPTRPKKTL